MMMSPWVGKRFSWEIRNKSEIDVFFGMACFARKVLSVGCGEDGLGMFQEAEEEEKKKDN